MLLVLFHPTLSLRQSELTLVGASRALSLSFPYSAHHRAQRHHQGCWQPHNVVELRDGEKVSDAHIL